MTTIPQFRKGEQIPLSVLGPDRKCYAIYYDPTYIFSKEFSETLPKKEVDFLARRYDNRFNLTSSGDEK